MMTLERFRSERGGCIGCVVPCSILVLIGAAGAVSTVIFAAQALWHIVR